MFKKIAAYLLVLGLGVCSAFAIAADGHTLASDDGSRKCCASYTTDSN